MTKDVTRYELISSHGFDHPSDEMVKDSAGSWVTYEYCESLKEQIERLTRERDLPRAAIEQLHAAVKTAQELAATRLQEVERLKRDVRQFKEAIYWALGERGDFPDKLPGCGPWYWRTELRKRSGLPVNGRPDNEPRLSQQARCHFGGSYGWCELEPGHDGPHRIPKKSGPST